MKKCLSETISLYEKAEKNILGKDDFTKRIKDLIDNVADFVDDMLKKEKYGENDDSCPMSEDPVNLSTGNFIYEHTDIEVAGEIPLKFRRFYNALDLRKGVLGISFLHNYEIFLEKKEGQSGVTVCMGDGKRKSFVKTAGGYIGERAVLETFQEKENKFLMRTIEGECYYFNKAGQLLRQENKNGRGITFIYNSETQLLEKAVNDNEAYLMYEYDSEGRLLCVIDHTKRKVILEYEGNFLKCVQSPSGQKLLYTYSKDGLITEIENANQIVVLKNHYFEDYRVGRQDFPDGSSMTFEYDDKGHCTILTERNGSKIIYIQDEQYRNTDIVYEDGTTEHFEYNDKNQKIKRVDRNGNVCRMAYDNRGNLTQECYESGLKINYTYDEKNNLLSFKMNEKERLHNTYDSKGNLLTALNADGTTSKALYDEKGRVVQIEEDGGNITHLFYDEMGNVNRIVNALGHEIQYLYDKLGRVIETTDANGNKTCYEYNENSYLTRVVNPVGGERKYQYTAVGKVEKVIDFDGYIIEASYNKLGKVEAYTDKEGNKTFYSYDKMWNVASKTTPDGAVIEYHYNADNRLTLVSMLERGAVSYEYDANGNLTALTDAEGNRTMYEYDANNRRVATISADGQRTSYCYNDDGNLISIYDAMGNEYSYTYDAMGRKISAKDPMGNVKKYTYCRGGKLASVTYPNGSEEKYEYDVAGQLIKIVKPDKTIVSLKYDKVGNVIEEANNFGQKYTYQYDQLNRMVLVTAPNGGKKKYTYDAVGHVVKRVDEKGNATHYEYSPNGNLIGVKDALGNKTCYEYDCMNRLCKVEQTGNGENSHTTMYEWDKVGRIAAMTDPLGYKEEYQYNKNGMLTSKTDREGYRTTYSYDEVGNLTSVLYEDGREVLYSYNALRQLKEVKDWIGKTTIELDAIGRPLAITNADGSTVQYRWENIPRQTDMIYPDGTGLHYEYDEVGRLKALSDGRDTTSYLYNEAGQLAEKVLPNGIHTKYTYNEIGRIENLIHEGDKQAESYHFTYDAVGNKIQTVHKVNGEMDEAGSFEYTYDMLNQLTGVYRKQQALRTYIYDGVGNRIEKQDFTGEDNICTKYQYNENNQLISTIENGELDTEKVYNYDRRGNLIQVLEAGQVSRQFVFDETNQLNISMTVEDQVLRTARYSYNALGQRVCQEIFQENMVGDISALSEADMQKMHVKEEVHYVLDWTKQYNNLLESREEVSGKLQKFFWDANVLAMQDSENKHYYLQDAQGSVVGLTDEAGMYTECYQYDEFGVQKGSERSKKQPFAFAGYQIDSVGEMYYAQARRYDAHMGRFISEDKISGFAVAPFTLNRYGYCWNQPVDLVDLDGRFPSWGEVQEWWNSDVYGEETVNSKTIGNKNDYAYWSNTISTTESSEKYTGEIIKSSFTWETVNGGNLEASGQYSINVPSLDLGNGNKLGSPGSVSVTVGKGGISIETNAGIDVGKLNYNTSNSYSINGKDVILQQTSYNVGYGDDSVGIDMEMGAHPLSNTKVGGHITHNDGNTSYTSRAGVYTKTGYLYAAAVAAYAAYLMVETGTDPSLVWQQYMGWIQQNGLCPV